MEELKQFRWVAFLEGLSFVLLLFVAMPLKYWAGLPLAVRIVGMVHGLLFVLFIGALFSAPPWSASGRRGVGGWRS